MSIIRDDIIHGGFGSMPWPMRGLAIHSTANVGATAQDHADYWGSGRTQYFAHYVADWKECIHTVRDGRVCYHLGYANPYYIGLEICEGRNHAEFLRSVEIAGQAAAEILHYYGWSVDGNMVTHEWCSWYYGGSDHTDPIPYFERYNYSWSLFCEYVRTQLRKLQSPSKPAPEPEPEPIPKGTPLQLWRSNSSEAQMFKRIFVKEENGHKYYKYQNKASGKMIDVYNGIAEKNNQVWVYEDNGSDAQLWREEVITTDYVQYVVLHSYLDDNLVLDVKADSKEPGALLQLFTTGDYNSQRFVRVFAEADYFFYVNQASGHPLDVVEGK